MEILATLLTLVLSSNIVMSAVKWLADGSIGRPGLRFALALVSMAGVIATSALTGSAVDFNSLTGIGMMLLESLGVALGAHLSYKAIKNA